MRRKTTIKLLLINESDNDSEKIIGLFRNAGRVVRGRRAASAEDLHRLLEEESWDLIVADNKHPEVTVEQCLAQLKKSATDIPSIVISNTDIEAALEAGACDVVANDDDQRLVFIALRELHHLEKRRELTLALEKLADSEQRCEQLMTQSQNALAYISDGMIINSNQLFSDRFGFESPEELDCLPIIDLIDPADQQEFKQLLKAQQDNPEDSSDFMFNGQKQDGEKFSAAMNLCSAVYDEEECIQIGIRDQRPNNNRRASDLHYDSPIGIYNKHSLLEQLDVHSRLAAAGSNDSTLLYVGVDKFINIRSRLGISHCNNILLDIASFIQTQMTDDFYLSHFCDDGFALLMPKTGEDQARKFSEKMCREFENHIIEVNDQSIQCTISIGLFILDQQNQTDSHNIIDHAFEACEQVRELADGDGVGNGVSVYVPTLEKKSFGDSQGDAELDTFLEEALEDGRFSLVFQPIVSLRGTSGEHYEVQARMTDDSDRELLPEEFLESIQFSETNTRLDRWIILEATKQLANKITEDPSTSLFINLTSHALQDKSLISWLGVVVKASGISPGAIIFQFDEATIGSSLKHAVIFSEQVKKIGCKLSISHFGRADDPFKTLKKFGADYAKIFSSFTTDLQAAGGTQLLKAMLSSIVDLKVQAIVSEVENAAAMAMLWQIGVDYIQGGYLAQPENHMTYEFTDIA